MAFDWWPPDGPWPTSPGGIRGPDNRNLTDLHNLIALGNTALAGIALQLAGIGSALDTLNTRLLWALGNPAQEPPGWPGLAGFLVERIAAAPGMTTAPRMDTALHQIVISLALLNERLNANGVPAEPGLLAQALADVSALLPELASISGDTAALSMVAGSVSALPVGSTLKDLLRSIDANTLRAADCCEEGQQPQQPVNPVPQSQCNNNSDASQVRVIGLVDVPATAPGGAVGATRIGLDFGSPTAGRLSYDAAASAQANYPVYLVATGPGSLSGCIEWDLTGNNAPPWTLERVLVEQVMGSWQATLASTLGTVFANGPDIAAFSLSSGLRYTFRLVYNDAEGSPPPEKNFFISYGINIG